MAQLPDAHGKAILPSRRLGLSRGTDQLEFLFGFEAGFYSVPQADLELTTVLLPQFLECWRTGQG